MILNRTSILIVRRCGIIVLIAGTLFIISLLFHARFIVQILPHYTPIKFNTCIGFLFSGVGLIFLSEKKNNFPIYCGLLIFLLGGLTLLEYTTHSDLDIDQYLFKSYIDYKTPYPGRMAPITAWGLILAGVIFLMKNYSNNLFISHLIRLLAGIIVIIGVIPFVGYLTGVKTAFNFGQFSPMSPQASIVFIVMGIGFNAYAWSDDLLKNKNIFAIWLSTILTAIVLSFSILLWLEGMKREKESMVLHLKEEADLIKHRIIDEMNYSILALKRMAKRWEIRNGTPEDEWRADVRNYLDDTSALKLIAWVDVSDHNQWTEPRSQDKNRLINYLSFKQIAAIRAEQKNNHSDVILSSPAQLNAGYQALIALIPLHEKKMQSQYIMGIYDIGSILAEAMSSRLNALLTARLHIVNQADAMHPKNKNPFNSLSVVFNLFGKDWSLLVIPKPRFYLENTSFLHYFELLSGVLFSLLLGSTLYFALTIYQRNKALIEKSKALAESEHRQQQIVDDVHGYAIFWLDLKGNVETWNSGAERIYGLPADEVIKHNYSIFFTQKAREESLPEHIIAKALSAGKFEEEVEHVRCDKSTFWANLIVEALNDTDGFHIGFAVIIRDVTAHRLLELERLKLISIIEESPDFIGMADLQGNLLFHNQSARLMVGLAPDADLSSMRIADMHPPWAFDLVNNVGVPSVFKGEIWTGETALLHQVTGEEIAVLQTLSLHKDAQSNPVCLTTVIRDIRERKKVEAELVNSELIFRSSMENAAIGMALVSPEGKWLKANKALCDMIGYTEEELLTLDFQAITHPEDLQNDLNHVQRMLDNEIQTYHIDKRYFRKDGRIIWISLNVTLAWKASGEPNYFIAQIQNITDRRHAEEAQEQLIAQLATSNMELERFAYVASHDMQEPLRMIVCFSDILIQDYTKQLDADAKEYLNIVSDSGKRMQEMVQDLLEYSRVSNDAKLSKRVDANAVLDHALENLKIPIEEAEAQITRDELPFFLGNSIQTVRLFQNLIVNSIKYQAKGATPIIHIGVEDQGKDWLIYIKDNGLGVPEEFSEQIFQPFRRLHTWSAIQGTGLGLAVCKKIVENHGGIIGVKPAPGQGAIFYFTLPKINERRNDESSKTNSA